MLWLLSFLVLGQKLANLFLPAEVPKYDLSQILNIQENVLLFGESIHFFFKESPPPSSNYAFIASPKCHRLGDFTQYFSTRLIAAKEKFMISPDRYSSSLSDTINPLNSDPSCHPLLEDLVIRPTALVGCRDCNCDRQRAFSIAINQLPAERDFGPPPIPHRNLNF